MGRIRTDRTQVPRYCTGRSNGSNDVSWLLLVGLGNQSTAHQQENKAQQEAGTDSCCPGVNLSFHNMVFLDSFELGQTELTS